MYYSTKKYGHDEGLSVCFRQWRANHSHCHHLHGYALAFEFTFGCMNLDERNWVVDFGALKPLREALKRDFDHRLLVAEDDPHLDEITALGALDVCNPLVLPKIGIEACAAHAYTLATRVIDLYAEPYRWVSKVQVWEHGGNSAVFMPTVPAVHTPWGKPASELTLVHENRIANSGAYGNKA